MSDREKAAQLLDAVPDYKISYVLAYLQGMTDGEIEEIEPDEWDLKMIEEAQRENDGETVAFHELAEELGLAL